MLIFTTSQALQAHLIEAKEHKPAGMGLSQLSWPEKSTFFRLGKSFFPFESCILGRRSISVQGHPCDITAEVYEMQRHLVRLLYWLITSGGK